MGVSAGLGSLSAGYADYWVGGNGGSPALGKTAAAYESLSWIPFVLLPATFLLLLFPAGFFALAWQARFERITREARALVHFLARRGLHARLVARRRELADELEALAKRVPEPVLSGETT